MDPDGTRADVQELRDLAVTVAGRDPREHL